MKISGYMVALLLLLSSLLAHAELALNQDVINRWVAVVEELQSWDDESLEYDDFQFDPGEKTIPDLESSMVRAAKENRKVRSLLERYGFSAQDWGSIGTRIIQAYSALLMGEQAPEMDSQMQQQMRELENNPHLSDQQKQMFRQQMQAATGMMRQMKDAPEADVAAVRSNRTRLDTVFSDD